MDLVWCYYAGLSPDQSLVVYLVFVLTEQIVTRFFFASKLDDQRPKNFEQNKQLINELNL